VPAFAGGRRRAWTHQPAHRRTRGHLSTASAVAANANHGQWNTQIMRWVSPFLFFFFTLFPQSPQSTVDDDWLIDFEKIFSCIYNHLSSPPPPHQPNCLAWQQGQPPRNANTGEMQKCKNTNQLTVVVCYYSPPTRAESQWARMERSNIIDGLTTIGWIKLDNETHHKVQ